MGVTPQNPDSEPEHDVVLLADAQTPLEHLDPVELVEVDEDGPEPPPEWGQDGAGEP